MKKYIVIGIDNLTTGYKNNIPKNVIFYKIDCSSKKIFQVLKKYKFDAILHFAGQSSGEISYENPINDINSNVISTINLIKFCIINNCKKFLYASSMSVYGKNSKKVNETNPIDPLSFYAIGKAASEKYLSLFQTNSIKISILRLFNVYGPGQDLNNLKQGMISIYLSQLLFNKEIKVKGSKKRYRDFVYIDDVVNTCLKVLKYNKKNYDIFNISTGRKTKVEDLLNKLIKISRIDKKIVYSGSTPGDQFGIYGNNTKLIKLIKNYNFIDIETGLKKTFKWTKNRKKKIGQ